MKKIFDAGEIELADLHGDPSRVLEIQQKVKELLSANTNRQRRESLKQEIIEKKAWALPGLINSTITWMKKFEGDKELHHLISGVMASTAEDNDAASRLIFQAGVVENPFPVPRAIAIKTLENLKWKPSAEDKATTRKYIRRVEKDRGKDLLLDLYSILLMTDDTQDMKIVLETCCDWIATEEGGKLLVRLINAFPNDVEIIIVEICDDLRKKGKYSDKDIANMLVRNLQPILVKRVVDETLVKITIRALPGNPPRHRVVEYLWRDAVKELHKNNEEWNWSIESVESGVYHAGKGLKDSQVRETLYRYWFQALNPLDKSSQERIYNAAKREEGNHEDEDWAIAAIVEMFYMSTQKKNRNAKQSLQEIEKKYPIRYDRAKDTFESIGPARPSDGIESIDKGSGLGKG